LVVAIIAVGAGLAIWKKKLGHSGESFNSISREEIELLVGDMAKQNPMMIKQIAQRPEMKKKQLDNLKQILAFASEAQREGLANDPTNRQTLNDIKAEIIAVSYDREINKDKGPMPPFGLRATSTTAFVSSVSTCKRFDLSLKAMRFPSGDQRRP